MKIQCNVCETAEAQVLCCADEAALCWRCDEKVHAANKLASKHQRVPLHTSSTHVPKCDICQEASGFFFCLEDRALLCRKCDVAIHTANVYVSGHQRFLLTGVKVGLEATEPGSSSSAAKSSSGDKVSAPSPPPIARRSPQMPMANEYNEILPAQAQIGNDLDFSSMRLPYAGGSTAGSTPQWHIDDFLGFSDIGQQYGYTDNGSSKQADSRGDSDSSYILRSAKEDLEDDECVGQVPESSWAVPQIPSPPTASGLNWPKNFQTRHDISFSVPDIYNSSSVQNSPQPRHSGTKRGRRQI